MPIRFNRTRSAPLEAAETLSCRGLRGLSLYDRGSGWRSVLVDAGWFAFLMPWGAPIAIGAGAEQPLRVTDPGARVSGYSNGGGWRGIGCQVRRSGCNRMRL